MTTRRGELPALSTLENGPTGPWKTPKTRFPQLPQPQQRS
jgi:hypothetical protein